MADGPPVLLVSVQEAGVRPDGRRPAAGSERQRAVGVGRILLDAVSQLWAFRPADTGNLVNGAGRRSPWWASARESDPAGRRPPLVGIGASVRG